MTARCQHEDELLDALGRRFIGPELAAHVAACESCNELQLVAGALLDDRIEAVREATVPSSGTMWWRMQMRQRLDAQAKARRSLLIGQAMTLAIAMALIGAFFGHDVATGVREMFAAAHLSVWVLAALAGSILLAPIAGYVAIRQK